MAAMNIPLITWCIIVAAMTALITVILFHKSCNPAQTSDTNHMLEASSEHDEFFMHGDLVTAREDVITDVDY